MSDGVEDSMGSSLADTDTLLSRGLLDIRLERLIKQVLRTPLSGELISKVGIKLSSKSHIREKMTGIMDKVFDMDMDSKLDLLKTVMFLKLRAGREATVWHTYQLSGEEPVTSPRGRRKIALRVRSCLGADADVTVETFEQAVWLVVFSSRQLRAAAQARRATALSATALVWYPGEAALYSNKSSCTHRLLTAVGTTLGYSEARPIKLSGRRLSSMRLMYTARKDRRFYDNSVPANQYPLAF